jgi:hypothetical protein
MGKRTQMLVFNLTKITATGITPIIAAMRRRSELPTALPITTAKTRPSSNAVQIVSWLVVMFGAGICDQKVNEQNPRSSQQSASSTAMKPKATFGSVISFEDSSEMQYT